MDPTALPFTEEPMLTRYLGGVAVCLGVVGTLAAQQQPAALLSRPKPKPAPTPTAANPKTAAPTYYPATPPTSLPTVVVPTPVIQKGPTAPGTPAQGPASGAAKDQTPKATATPTPKSAAPTAPATPAAPAYAANMGYAPGCAVDPATGACPSACSPCDCLCGPPGKFWVSGEWLYWRTSGNHVPALVTAAPPGTARDAAGVLGAPGTSVLIGNQSLNNDYRSGFRLYAGMWLDPCQLCGVEGMFHFLGQSRNTQTVGSDGTRIVTRPFFNVLEGRQDTQLVSFPGVLRGTTTVDSTNDVIGGGLNMVKNICCQPCSRLDLLLGYRYLNIRDDLVIRENLVGLPGSNAPGTQFQILDRFQTNTSFHGPSVGLRWEKRFNYWYVAARGSLAMGVSHQEVTISGATVITNPTGASQTFPGGLLTQTSNIGKYENNRFAVMPEVGVRVGLQVTDRMRVFAGYDFLYLSSVARAGDQIDLRVNPNQIAPPQPLNGPALPAFTPRSNDFWAHGVSAGVEFRF
jgi:hypothetical protein